MAKTLLKLQVNKQVKQLKAKLVEQGLKPKCLPANAHFEIAAQAGAELVEDVSQRVRMDEKLVCLMRVKNEATKLARCLDSMPFLAGLIIVDNSSTDDTVEIASSYAATILHTTDLNASRDLNLAYAEAKKQGATWCLWMDADEEWEAQAANRFRDLLKPGPINGWQFRIYPFVVSYPYYRIDRDWAQFTMRGQLRLFRVQDGIHWDDPRPTHPGLPRGLQGAIGKSDLRIKHHTIETEEELERKIAFYEGLDGRDFSHLRDGPDAVYKKFLE